MLYDDIIHPSKYDDNVRSKMDSPVIEDKKYNKKRQSIKAKLKLSPFRNSNIYIYPKPYTKLHICATHTIPKIY